MEIETQLEAFRVMMGRYPTQGEGLRAFVERPDTPDLNPERWKVQFRRLPLDPWGNEFVDLAPSAEGRAPRVYSRGRDGVSHSNGSDPDDINSWSEAHRGGHYNSSPFLTWAPRLLRLGVGFLFTAAAVFLSLHLLRRRQPAVPAS
jgi:type II secretion system protein G